MGLAKILNQMNAVLYTDDGQPITTLRTLELTENITELVEFMRATNMTDRQRRQCARKLREYRDELVRLTKGGVTEVGQ